MRRAAVLGSPIVHSLSPALHRAAYRALGLDWGYEARELTAEQLPAFLAGLDDSWAGLSLTMPCKTAIIPLLDIVEPLAARLGSVNTVVLGDGRRAGYNTDVAGLAGALREFLPGLFPPDLLRPTSIEAVNCDVVLLGGGATARSALAALAGLNVRGVHVVTRRPEAAAELLALAEELGLELTPLSLQDWIAAPRPAALTLSTLPGAAWASGVPVLGEPVGPLFDVSYSPDPPPLVAAWRAAGDQATGGLAMLVGQAVRQVELLTGLAVTEAVEEAMWAAVGSTGSP
ncbi:MAG: shikimate dehydrogenase [Candidatus Nanopelagicales bacterium]